jgi:hypothetical protein
LLLVEGHQALSTRRPVSTPVEPRPKPRKLERWAFVRPELARLQDEQREDHPQDYENGKPHKYRSEHGEQLPALGEDCS